MQRFTISLDDSLAQRFDHWMADHGYDNRSEAVRDLLRTELEKHRQAQDHTLHCVACLSYVFNHHARDLAGRLNQLQHDHHDLAVSTLHAHLDQDNCLETVVLRGPSAAVRAFADAVCAERGVHHGHLNLISVEGWGHRASPAPPAEPGHSHAHAHPHPNAAPPPWPAAE